MVGTGVGKRVLRVIVGGGCGVWDVLLWVRLGLVAPPGVESSPCLLADRVGGGWVRLGAAVGMGTAGMTWGVVCWVVGWCVV